MPARPDLSPTPAAVYRPALAWFALLSSLWVFVLVTLGAFTTSIGAGMAFADWPLSNGSINPEGWLTDLAMFAEHSHRLSGTTMGLLTIALVVWISLEEPRRWLRWLSWAALAVVVVQGLLGGLRVTLDAVDVPLLKMSLGQALRIPHGVLAQVFVCLLFALSLGLSRSWLAQAQVRSDTGLRKLSVLSCALLMVQLVVAAVMRHNHAGLAIPTFPLTPTGGLVPQAWDFAVAIHFAHRVLAALLTVVLGALVLRAWRSPWVVPGLRRLASVIAVLLLAQLTLGAATVWTQRDVYLATAHVLTGALLLATTFSFMWCHLQHRLEPVTPTTAQVAATATAASPGGPGAAHDPQGHAGSSPQTASAPTGHVAAV